MSRDPLLPNQSETIGTVPGYDLYEGEVRDLSVSIPTGPLRLGDAGVVQLDEDYQLTAEGALALASLLLSAYARSRTPQ